MRSVCTRGTFARERGDCTRVISNPRDAHTKANKSDRRRIEGEREEEKGEENLFIILESKSHRDKSDFVTCIHKSFEGKKEIRKKKNVNVRLRKK